MKRRRTPIGILILAILASAAPARASQTRDLMSCYQELLPYSAAGSHAEVYPDDSSMAFIPGNYGGKAGLWIYTDQGASFAAIEPGLANKTVAFDFSGGKQPENVIYQPAAAGHGPRIWLRNPGSNRGVGVTLLFTSVDDPARRAPLEAELQAMAQGMVKTWETREDELVKAVDSGRYVWVDVDIDNYKGAAAKCAKAVTDSPETASLRGSIQSAIGELNQRAERTGVVRENHPSTFMSTPQY